jgi:gamma-glutamyltranspeptidase
MIRSQIKTRDSTVEFAELVQDGASLSSRSTVMARKGMVSSSHELASFWGANVLLKGGNVVDAAIATSAVLSVVQNNMCGLGGDLFALLKVNGKVVELNSSGRAAELAAIDFYEKKGFSHIPTSGPLSANTVPGMVRGWGELSKLGTMEINELLQPAINYAEDGFPITEKYVQSIRNSEQSLGAFDEWDKIFLPKGRVPDPGIVFKQKDLAASLRTIAKLGADDFYEGELSKKITDGVAQQEGIISSEDLRNHESNWNDNPLSTNYRGVKVYETSPNSQAATVLLWLNMLESFELDKMELGSDKYDKIMLDTCLKAYAQRAKSIADPQFFPLKPGFTSKKFAEELLNSNETDQFPGSKATRADGDTTYFAVADSEGNCLSVIQSNYMGFGSGLVPEGTGIVLHNRGCYFSLDRSHHNSIAPGKRTFHTLCASIGEKDDEMLFAIGSMGGDVQPQIHAQLMTQIIDFKEDLQHAIDRPRWVVPMTIYESPSKIYTEFEPSRSLRTNGLEVIQSNCLSSLFGHAQAIYRKENGLFGAADPRGDGASVGF